LAQLIRQFKDLLQTKKSKIYGADFHLHRFDAVLVGSRLDIAFL
jgi:hypothetical protein